jgi:branched-chain amino acid transport system permease protein
MKDFALTPLLIGVCILLPLIYPQAYFVHLLALSAISAILAMGLQLVFGYAGQISIAHGAFFGIGAYASALLMLRLNCPFILAFLVAGATAALWSLVLIPIVRLRGPYLAVSTLGFAILVHLLILNEEWLTEGPFGLINVPSPQFGSWVLGSERSVYYLCLACAILVYFGLRRIVNSRFGRALEAIDQNEEAARSCGIHVIFYKSKCFLVAAFTAGLAGSLSAHLTHYLNPNDFTFWKSIQIILMIVVGGLGSLEGAVLGAIILTLLPEYLRAWDDVRMLIYGLLVMVFMAFGKKGVMGLLEDAAAWFGRRLRRSKSFGLAEKTAK